MGYIFIPYRKLSKSEKKAVKLLEQLDNLAQEEDFNAKIFGMANGPLLFVLDRAETDLEFIKGTILTDRVAFCSDFVKGDGGDPDLEQTDILASQDGETEVQTLERLIKYFSYTHIWPQIEEAVKARINALPPRLKKRLDAFYNSYFGQEDEAEGGE
jgi:hypothetical protein